MKEHKKTVIQLATMQDAIFIAMLGRITFTETFGNLFTDRNDLLYYLENTFSVEKIRNSLSKKENVFFIAFVDEFPVGYGKLKLDSNNTILGIENACQLQKIYVLQDFLSLGIGKSLQNKLLKTVIENGFNSIWLSVLECNQRAMEFYIKSGYQNVGTHDYTIGKEDFNFNVMYKKL